MTKAEIVEQIYEQVGFSKKEAAELVETVFEIIKETLASGEKVKISGFGNFVVRDKNARKGRNPQTGEEILLEARRVLTFKPSLVLKNVLNEQPGTSEDPPLNSAITFTINLLEVMSVLHGQGTVIQLVNQQQAQEFGTLPGVCLEITQFADEDKELLTHYVSEKKARRAPP